MTNMYYSFVFPYLTYCVEIWGSSFKSYLDPLVKCIRTISFSEYCSLRAIISEIKYFKLRKTPNTKNKFNDV